MSSLDRPTQAPILSTPESHIFEDPTPIYTTQNTPKLSDDELYEIYEIERTAQEVRDGGYRRVALQLPDAMLRDAPRVFEALEKEVGKLQPNAAAAVAKDSKHGLETNVNDLSTTTEPPKTPHGTGTGNGISVREDVKGHEKIRFSILADTSYGACCVDEIAAEHVDADVVVHYGRSCLSPTARLPVIYVFTTRPLAIEDVVRAVEEMFSGAEGKEEKVVLMADITYQTHVPKVRRILREKGYSNLLVPEVIHDPSSAIPNRKVEEGVDLRQYTLFHISDPQTALLLTLSSRVKEMFIYPTDTISSSEPQSTIRANTSMTLRRRYALLTSLSTCSVFGILINTLSVRNYLSTVSQITSLISASGKKSYTFVVGKVNAAKIANFSEIGGWVVIGCWESSLIESTEFYRPIITPFELSLALQSDESRVWTGEWRGDFEGMMLEASAAQMNIGNKACQDTETSGAEEVAYLEIDATDEDSEEESAPPEFDLRTGRYVSHTRPMRTTHNSNPQDPGDGVQPSAASKVLARRAKDDLATVNGAVSPGAEYLKNQRTWQGLGSDFHEEEANQNIEEGRRGVARGYTVGEGEERR
jgi:diphthamide biosynthesis protein 2